MKIENDRRNEMERIIDKYQDGLFRFAFFRTGSLQDSQDIVQNIFLKMAENRIDPTAITNVKSYLYRSISNSCVNYLRNNRPGRFVSLDLADTTGDQETREWEKEYERIASIMEAIPYDQAEVIRMKTIDGLAFTKIAEVLGIPVTTVKSRFKYGIDKIKAKIN